MDKELLLQSKFLSKPLFYLFIVSVMIVSVFVMGAKKINQVNEKLLTSQNSLAELTQKYNILSSVPRKVEKEMAFFDVALPDKSALLFGLSQVKKLTAKNNLGISNVKTATQTPLQNDVFKANISFTALGSATDMFNFLEDVSKSLPLMNLEKLKITQDGDQNQIDITLNVYSSVFPEKIPSLTSPVTDLTSQETDSIHVIEGYSIPDFVTAGIQEFDPKEDLFN